MIYTLLNIISDTDLSTESICADVEWCFVLSCYCAIDKIIIVVKIVKLCLKPTCDTFHKSEPLKPNRTNK